MRLTRGLGWSRGRDRHPRAEGQVPPPAQGAPPSVPGPLRSWTLESDPRDPGTVLPEPRGRRRRSHFPCPLREPGHLPGRGVSANTPLAAREGQTPRGRVGRFATRPPLHPHSLKPELAGKSASSHFSSPYSFFTLHLLPQASYCPEQSSSIEWVSGHV